MVDVEIGGGGITMESLANDLGIPVINYNRRYWCLQLIQEELIAQFLSTGKLNTINNNYLYSEDELDQCNIGDVLLIPLKDNEQVVFGIITSEIGETILYPEKKVNWIKKVDRKMLDPILYRVLYDGRGLRNSDEYADQIDRLLEGLYVKGDKVYLTIHINQNEDIKANDLYSLYRLVHETLNINEENIVTKVNIQSAGIWQLISDNVWMMVAIILAIQIAIGGGKISFLKGIIGELETPGLANWLYKFLELKNQNHIELQKIEIEKLKMRQEYEEIIIEENRNLCNELESYRETLERLKVEIPATILEIRENEVNKTDLVEKNKEG